MQRRVPRQLGVLVVEPPTTPGGLAARLRAGDEGPFTRATEVTVRAAASVRHAMDVLTDAPADAIVMDLGSEEAEHLGEIRTLATSHPDVAILAVGRHDGPTLAHDVLGAGAQDLLLLDDALTGERLLRAIVFGIERIAQHNRLRDSHRELSAYAHAVAHDIKTPLTSILGSLQLLSRRRDRLDQQAVARLVEQASESGWRLHEMVDGLLSYAEATGSVRAAVPVALDDVAAWTSSVLSERIHQTGATLRIDPLPVVTGNMAALRQVFLNLVSNALKYTVEGRPPHVHLASRLRADGFHEIVVADNGVGVPDADRERIFGLGERLDDAVDGQGIGLNAVRRAVEAHGGQIWITSGDDGVGSAFHLTLPSAPDEGRTRATA